MTKTSIVVTGSNGFIGSHLVQALLKSNYKVGVINRTPPKHQNVHNYQHFKSFSYDGSEQSIQQALELTQPDLVIHLASYFIPRHQPGDVALLVASNIDFPTKLLDVMSRFGVEKLINTGTFWQHYQNANYDPVSLYAATKQAFEDILILYVNSRKVDAITLKLFDTYGQGDTRPKILNLLIKAVKTGAPLRLSLGEQKLNLVHISDVVRAYEISIERLLNRSGFQHESFGVANDTVFTLQELSELVEEICGGKIRAEWGALPYRDREVMQPWSEYDVLPQWKAQISLEEGLKVLHAFHAC